MDKPRILIVDDDERMRGNLKIHLESRGYSISEASNGEEGLKLARELRPDLILLDVIMPQMDGWTMIKRLRVLPQFTLLPVIFLTAKGDTEDRIRGFRLGADDYLPKPANPKELEVRIGRALQRRQTVKSVTAVMEESARQSLTMNPSSFRGTLQQIGIASVLTVLDMEGREGVLVIKKADDEVVRISFRNGKLIRAVMQGKTTARGKDAIYELLNWGDGSFWFTEGQVDGEDEIASDTRHLLLEGARRLDETARRER